MKNIIIASGHLGSTVKAAEILAEMIGGADIFDTLQKPQVGLGGYDNYIFGANIRMFRINGRMKKWAKKLKKEYCGKRVFVYLTGSNQGGAADYCKRAAKLVPQAESIRFVGGELNAEKAKGFSKVVIESVRADSVKNGKELPRLLTEELSALAEQILSGEKR